MSTIRTLAVCFAVCGAALAAGGQRRAAVTEFKPAVVRYGATIAETRAALGGNCKTLVERRIDPPFRVLRDTVKDRQVQLDCDGFRFFGKPRWAEFVFADDSLEMVWILTEAEEERSFLKALADAYGPPAKRNDKFVAFTGGRAALRTDRPEVLFYSERLAPKILPWFEKESTFR